MRILFISARGDSFGGASLHVRDMARRLTDDGHHARIAVGGTPDMEVPQRFAEKDLDFFCIPEMGRSISPKNDLKSIARLRKEIKSFQPDLISAHASKAGALARLAAIGLPTPVVYTPHCWSFVDGFPNAWLYRTAEKIFAPWTSKIVAVCEDEREFGLKMGVGDPGQTISIHNGVIDYTSPPNTAKKSTAKVRPAADLSSPVNLLMVGRFEEQKDHPLLIRTLSELKHLPWKLTLVGAGPRLEECQTLTNTLGISDRVHFAGYSSDVEKHLAEADVFTLISNWEGFPRSILESMRAALPSIVSDVGGSREAVLHGHTGFVVPKGDPAPLRSALATFLTDPQKRAEMGHAARRHYESKFTFEHMYQKYRDLYNSLAAEMKDLAILIPAYNDQAGLDATLASIVEADNRFTVVIVDDGSTTPIVVDPSKYSFPITLIHQPENGGIVKALNTGLEHIVRHGFRYVARLDAADLNHPDRFKQQYLFLETREDIQLVGSNARFLSETDDRELFVTNLPLDDRGIKKWMVFRNCFIHPTVMLRTACLAEAGHYDAGYPHVEDFVFFSRIVEKFPCANIGEPLVECYVREGGISRKYGKQQLLSGMKFSWQHKKPLNPLWYAYMSKRLAYFALPFRLRNGIKNLLGFVKKPAQQSP